MEFLMLIIIIIIIVFCAIAIFYASLYNKFQDYIIRINEVESMIDDLLRNKYDLINRAIPIIKTSIPKDKNIFDDVIKLRSRKLSNFDLYRILVNASNEFTGLREEYNDINKSEEIIKIATQMEGIDEKLEDLFSYYNENITIYNSMIKKFPTNIIAIINKYKEKLFFDRKDMSDEDYNDFKL